MNHTKIVALFLVTLCAGAFFVTPVAASDTGQIGGTFQTANQRPQIVSITPSTNIVNPTPDSQTSLLVTVQVRDYDGNADIRQVNVAVYSTTPGWWRMDEVSPAEFEIVDEYTVNVHATLQFEYWWAAEPDCLLSAVALDSGGWGTISDYPGPLEYTSAIGLALDGPTTLDFGSLSVGVESAAQTSTIHNSANTQLVLRGDALPWTSTISEADAVPASSLTANGVPMGSTTAIASVSPGSSTTKDISFVETVPSGSSIAGTYSTTITLTASNS